MYRRTHVCIVMSQDGCKNHQLSHDLNYSPNDYNLYQNEHCTDDATPEITVHQGEMI